MRCSSVSVAAVTVCSRREDACKWVGPIRSLKTASIIGFGGAILFALWAIESRSIWLGIIAFFIFAQAQAGWRAAQNLAMESEGAARREAAISPPPIPERQR